MASPARSSASPARFALEEQAAQLQQAGQTEEALHCLEQAVRLGYKAGARDGPSPRMLRTMHNVADLCNSLAMQRLSANNFEDAKVLLRRAEAISERESSLRAITYNNLACLYRRQGHLRSALQFLCKALDIESSLTDAHNPSDTHLNICAIQSQLGRHELALEHAQAALVMLHAELFDDPSRSLDGTLPFPPVAERMSVLAIAYHNMGVEQEFLGQWEASLLSYKRAMQLARLHVGEGHPVTMTLSQAYDSARRKLGPKVEEREQKRVSKLAASSSKLLSSSSLRAVTPPNGPSPRSRLSGSRPSSAVHSRRREL